MSGRGFDLIYVGQDYKLWLDVESRRATLDTRIRGVRRVAYLYCR